MGGGTATGRNSIAMTSRAASLAPCVDTTKQYTSVSPSRSNGTGRSPASMRSRWSTFDQASVTSTREYPVAVDSVAIPARSARVCGAFVGAVSDSHTDTVAPTPSRVPRTAW